MSKSFKAELELHQCYIDRTTYISLSKNIYIRTMTQNIQIKHLSKSIIH